LFRKEDYQKIEKFYTKEELQSFTAEEAVKMRITEADKQYDRVVSLIKDCSDSESSLFVGKIKFYSETIEKLESKGFRFEFSAMFGCPMIIRW
jgi:hypothetical protein